MVRKNAATGGASWEPVRRCDHAKVTLVGGWTVCMRRCGYMGVCRACVPGAPAGVPTEMCEGHMQALGIGVYGVRSVGLEDE